MASPHSGVVVFKFLPILLAHVVYGSKGSVSSIINSLFAPVFFRMCSRISSRLLSKNLCIFILLYVILVMYAFAGMLVAANCTSLFVVEYSFDISFIDTFIFPVAVFNFIDIAEASGLFVLSFSNLITTLSPSASGLYIYPFGPIFTSSPAIPAPITFVVFDIWYAYSSCLFAW